jgi:hypothetical protein
MRSSITVLLVTGALLLMSTGPSFAAGISGPGVYQGTLGKNKVTACFNENGGGSYYYQRHLKPIALTKQDTHGLQWQEKDNTGNWQLDEVTQEKLTGNWSSDRSKNLLPLRLERLESADGVKNCSSDAYNLPLEARPKLVKGPWKSAEKLTFRELTYGAEQGIEFQGTTPAIKAINTRLHKELTSDAQLKRSFEARRDALAQTGGYEVDETSANLGFVNEHWITIGLYRWIAGTGRSGISTQYLSFSLKTGKQFHPWQWFIDDVNPAEMKHQLPTALRTKFFAGKVVDPKCPNSDGSGMYDLLIAKDGVGFSEEPIGDGCENEFFLSADEAIPFSTKWGESQLKELK